VCSVYVHFHSYTDCINILFKQTTGESSWDPPQPVAAPQPAPTPANGHEAVHQVQPTANGSSSAGVLKTQKVANKYGDGFVTSASNPQLAEQYGNVGTR
jgi:protein transport protein SEC31